MSSANLLHHSLLQLSSLLREGMDVAFTLVGYTNSEPLIGTRLMFNQCTIVDIPIKSSNHPLTSWTLDYSYSTTFQKYRHDMSAGLIPIECSQSTLPTLNTYAQSAYISTRTPQHPTGSKTHPILLLMFTTEWSGVEYILYCMPVKVGWEMAQ